MLTALHVVAQSSGRAPVPGGQIRVRVLRDRQVHPVEVVWVGDRDLDAVLLSGDPGRLGRDLVPARWGELTCSAPTTQSKCSAVGFPKAAHRTFANPDGSQAVVHDNREIIGHVSAVTGINAAKYDVDVANSVPDGERLKKGWSGLSGAGLFCNEILIGLVQAVPDAWRNRTLWALPVRRLLELGDFTAAVAAHTGITPQLESADQSPLFHAPPVPHLSPSYLLSPQAEVVPFTGMDQELADLTSWCTSRRVVDVAVVFGPGGVGKTRLATELMRRMTQRRSPWTAGFLSDVQRVSGSLESLAANIRPLLLVLDYAETRVDQVEQVLRLFKSARHAYDKVRVLLLARPAQRWWKYLQLEWQGSPVMDRGTVVRLTASAAHSRAGNFNIATKAFRERIARFAAQGGPANYGESGSDPEAVDGGLSAEPTDELVVSIHMAALAQVLERTDVSAVDTIRPVDVLLAHETRYWRHSVRSHGLEAIFPRQSDLLRELVAVQRIVGAEERRDALNAVVAAFRFHDRDFGSLQLPDRDVMRRVEQMLADLYPATDGARWGAMSPDVLAAELIVRADRDTDGELVAHILPDVDLSPVQRHRAMTVLARATTHQPALADSVTRAVNAAPEALLAAAVDVAAELPPGDAVTWLNAIKPAAIQRSDGGYDTANQLRLIESLLDELVSGSSPTMEADPEVVPEVARDFTTGTPGHPSPTPKHFTLQLPPDAYPSGREPVPVRFYLESGAFVDPPRKQRMDHALSLLADESHRSNRALPAVKSVLLLPDGSIELNLATAAEAISPFQSQGPEAIWHCSSRRVLPPLSDGNSIPPAYPALVLMGWGPSVTLTFMDLEQVRRMDLHGPMKEVRQMLGELAFEFTQRPYARRPHIHVSGVPLRTGVTRYTTQHDTLEGALEAISSHADQTRSALRALGHTHVRDARVRDPWNDLWKPLVVLIGHEMTGDAGARLDHILHDGAPAGVGVVVRAPSSSQVATGQAVALDP
ncbi:hypothetical protein GPJ59_10810 [Streptomyces bambusae]|uniref:ATP-binding protein n=1 Tax=Streptomyces bambusae TaxID=1550616 RepID=A0ABS6Z6P4_9ACTN|nr:hypothetical protein [Streptomyces bambusae]